jgi:hypothetical protein
MEVLHGGGVRFLVAGGLAVNAHGLLRFTADVDIVIQLVPENIHKTFAALSTIGYCPIVPVTPEGFADTRTRQGWIADKGMRVLQFRSDEHKTVAVDVFVDEPFPFDEEYAKSLSKPLTKDVTVHFVSLETLIRMKSEAGRPQDLADIDALRQRMRNHDTPA